MRPPLSSTEPPVRGKYGFFVIFPIGSFTKHVYTYIYYVIFVCLFVLFCVVQGKKKERRESLISNRFGLELL